MFAEIQNWFRIAAVGTAMFPAAFPYSAKADPVPAPILKNLASDAFADREGAQRDLVEWSRKNPAKSIPTLYQQAIGASDPEIQSRCLSALKELVIESEYQSDGYLGIQMQEEPVAVPGDAKPRRAIRVVMVMPGSAAEMGGISAGDVIIGLNDKIWRNAGMAAEFGKAVSKSKPGTTVNLQILNEGKVGLKKVMLGEKPRAPIAMGQGNIENANRAAKDQFFQRWLDKREAGAR